MVEPKLSPKWSVMERRFYTQACAGPRKNYNMTFLKWHYWSQWHSWSGHCSGEGSWWTNLRACLTFTISPPLLSELREKCKIAILIKYQRNNLVVAYLPTWDENMQQEKKMYYGKVFDFCVQKCI